MNLRPGPRPHPESPSDTPASLPVGLNASVEGPAVQKLNSILKDWAEQVKLHVIPTVNARWTNATSQVLSAFQAANSLAVRPFVDRATRDLLRIRTPRSSEEITSSSETVRALDVLAPQVVESLTANQEVATAQELKELLPKVTPRVEAAPSYTDVNQAQYTGTANRTAYAAKYASTYPQVRAWWPEMAMIEPFRQASYAAARVYDLPPSLPMVIALNERMNKELFPAKTDRVHSRAWWESQMEDPTQPIDGKFFGLNTISDDLRTMQHNGQLRRPLPHVAYNLREGKERGNSATFSSVQDAMEAVAARFWLARNQAKETWSELQSIGLLDRKPTPDELIWWGHVAYTSGPGTPTLTSRGMYAMLRSYARKDFLANTDYLMRRPNNSWRTPHAAATLRYQNQKAMEQEGIFDPD